MRKKDIAFGKKAPNLGKKAMRVAMGKKAMRATVMKKVAAFS